MQIIYRDRMVGEFVTWFYNDKGKQEFIPIIAAIRKVNAGQAIMVDTPEVDKYLAQYGITSLNPKGVKQ